MQTNRSSDPNKIIWTQSSDGRGRGGQSNTGSDQASEPSVKAPLFKSIIKTEEGFQMKY